MPQPLELDSVAPYIRTFAYEPTLPNSDKSIDFRAEFEDRTAALIDVKTIKPASKDRCDQYERAVKERWISNNVAFVLDKNWLGGELWRFSFAARSRMLEYSIELEEKIRTARILETGETTVLLLCGEGSY